jgi:hypothetical protein
MAAESVCSAKPARGASLELLSSFSQIIMTLSMILGTVAARDPRRSRGGGGEGNGVTPPPPVSPGYVVSARVQTPYPGDLNHCRSCTPDSEDRLKESPKHVRQE